MREKIVPIEVTPEMMKMLEICKKNKSINPELYTKYDVKRGLRDINGKGVLAGLTEIGEIHAYDTLSLTDHQNLVTVNFIITAMMSRTLLKVLSATKGLALKKLHIYFFSANFQIKMSLIFSQRHFHICELFPLHLCVILSCKHRVRI